MFLINKSGIFDNPHDSVAKFSEKLWSFVIYFNGSRFRIVQDSFQKPMQDILEYFIWIPVLATKELSKLNA